MGIEFAAPKVAEAQELWRRVGVAVGTERRDHVWDHPDFLPTAEDLESSAEFIDALLDDSSGSDFDPIAEITKLEEMLASEGRILRARRIPSRKMIPTIKTPRSLNAEKPRARFLS